MTFGERLAALRKARQLTQDGLAEALNVSQPKYNKWENDINRPDYETVVQIARFYNSTTDYLLGLDDQPSRPDSDMYALTGLEPQALKRLIEIRGTILHRTLNHIIVWRDSWLLACIDMYLYPDNEPITFDFNGRKFSISRQEAASKAINDALCDMSQQI